MREEERYSRQSKVEGWNQSAISSSKVIIVGVGALGSVVAMNMVMAGVGKIVLIDMDTIELSNLNRQILFKESDIGKFKSEIAKIVLSQINPNCIIESYTKRVQEIPGSIFTTEKSSDSKVESKLIIVDALDNFETRRWLNSLAVSKTLLLVSGGMYGTLGNVQIIIPNETPCLECQPLIPERELQKACSLPGDVRKEKQMEKKVDIELNLSENSKISDEEYFPALGSVSSIIGGIMAHETLNLIHNSNDTHPVLDKYLFIDVHSQSYLQVPLLKREDCIVCSNIYKLRGIPFIVEKGDTLKLFREKISLQFNLIKDSITISSLGQDLTEDEIFLQEILEETSSVYIFADELPLPMKIQIQWLN